MNDDYMLQTKIEDRKMAIEFYRSKIEWLSLLSRSISDLRQHVLDRNDYPDILKESDAIAKACCEYLIKYINETVQEYDGDLREEQNALMELES